MPADPFSSAVELAAAIRARRASAAQLVELYLERISRHNPALNAVCTLDATGASRRAREADAALARGELWGPLHGVPMTIKDALETAGLRTTGGHPPLKDYVPALDAPAVARLRAAGAILLGKTNVPPLSADYRADNPIFGRTNNPWDLERTPGGSSGGAAAAVAAGLVPIAHANDAGGSIRIPASFCGLVGLKPSRGRTSLGPAHAELWHGLCEEGVLARTVRDAAASLDAVAGYMPGDPWMAPPPLRPFRDQVGEPPGRLRIGFMDRAPLFHPGLHPECAKAVRGAARLLESLGHEVEARTPAALDDATLSSAFGKVVYFESSITPAQRELAYLTASASNNCHY